MKIDKRDQVFSKLVRERANWQCEMCGTKYPPPTTSLHCSHIFSRRARSTRWLPENAAAHCFACHLWFGANPILGGEWAQKHLEKHGVDLEQLKRRFYEIEKLSKNDLEDIYQNLKSEYERMLSLRAEGKTGRIEFSSPYPMVTA